MNFYRDCINVEQAKHNVKMSDEYIAKLLSDYSDHIAGASAAGQTSIGLFFPTSLSKKLTKLLMERGFSVIKQSESVYLISWE